MVCICLMLVFDEHWLDMACMVLIVATTVYSGAEYFLKNRDVIDWKHM